MAALCGTRFDGGTTGMPTGGRRPFGSMPSSLSARTKRPMRLAFLRDHDDTGDRNNFVCFKVLLRAPQTDLPMARYPRRRGHVEPKVVFAVALATLGPVVAMAQTSSSNPTQAPVTGAPPSGAAKTELPGLLLALPPLRHRLTRQEFQQSNTGTCERRRSPEWSRQDGSAGPNGQRPCGIGAADSCPEFQ